MSTLNSIFVHKSTSVAIIIPSIQKSLLPPISLTYTSLLTHIQSFKSQLISLTSIAAHDPVSIILPNSIEFTIVFLATTLLRNVAAPLNPNYTEEEFRFYLEDSQSKVVILPKGWSEENRAAVKAARRFDVIVLEVQWDFGNEEMLVELKQKAKRKGNQVTDVSAEIGKRISDKEDTALLLHTSGTTGRPKGVPLTHKNLTTTMKNIVNTYKLTSHDRTLLVMPLFHVHGLMCGLLASLLAGGMIVIPSKFSASTFWKDFIDYGCSWYTAVPTIHQILLQHPLPQTGVPKIRFIRSCSSSLAPVTLHQLEEKFKAPVLEAYAMTEAAHQMTSNPLPPLPHKPGSVGIGQGVQVTILDQHGNSAEEGEVCIKGPNVTRGYINNPTANKSSFTKDGWFRTGDQGKFDADGYLFLTGRIKELINRGGEKISPLEIDGVLLSHPSLSEAVSFAVPDEMYGQEVHAAVVLKHGRSITENELKKFCETKLTKFKIPKRIYFTEIMPKTATGKIQRKNYDKMPLPQPQKSTALAHALIFQFLELNKYHKTLDTLREETSEKLTEGDYGGLNGRRGPRSATLFQQPPETTLMRLVEEHLMAGVQEEFEEMNLNRQMDQVLLNTTSTRTPLSSTPLHLHSTFSQLHTGNILAGQWIPR
ncbi:hypothetical protein G9A89_010542 [Geosiphon pyriformis]|nr:hypothetical protein G9A89_010542 [Geosiphon pyriformis]